MSTLRCQKLTSGVFGRFGAGPLDPDGGPSGRGRFTASLRADTRDWAIGDLAALASPIKGKGVTLSPTLRDVRRSTSVLRIK